MADEWAVRVASKVGKALDAMPQEWLDPRDFGALYGYSEAQAAHICRRAAELGTLERAKFARRYVYRLAVASTPEAIQPAPIWPDSPL